MTNISPESAAKIYQIITRLNNDINLKKQFMSGSQKVFGFQNQIIIDDGEIIIEDNPGYGLYFAIKNTSSSDHINSADNTTQETFANHHFSDCLHY